MNRSVNHRQRAADLIALRKFERAAQEARERTRELFAFLTPRQRELVDLVDLQGLSPREVADDLGLSGGAVRSQLHQARRSLRSAVRNEHEIRSLLREA